MCLMMGISSTLLLPLAWCLPALACLLFVFGVTQAAMATLVYIHVAQRLEQLGKHVAAHVSMCMYMIAIALGAGLGNIGGGALQSSNGGLQLGLCVQWQAQQAYMVQSLACICWQIGQQRTTVPMMLL
jgi:hypothetical protein